jgi:hypothetical protein
MVDKNSSNPTEEPKDIRPVRSETISLRSGKSIGGSSLLFTATLGFINLAGLVLISFWFFNTSDNQQTAGQGFVERISTVEETLFQKNIEIEELIDSTGQDLKFMNKEIRKLWDLTNKKNRKEIQFNLQNVNDLKVKMAELLKSINSIGAKQRARDLEFAKLEKQLSILESKINDLSPENNDGNLEGRLILQEEAQEAMDVYRVQVNKTLMNLQKQTDRLQIKLELYHSEQATSQE